MSTDNTGAGEAPHLVTIEPTTLAVRPETVRMDAIRDYFDDVYSAVMAVISEQGLAPIGAAYAVYRGMPGETVDVAAGFPTASPITQAGAITALALPTGRAVRYVHRGPYDRLGEAYGRVVAWAEEHGHPLAETYWEIYVTEPSPEADPNAMVTEINWALAEDWPR